MAVSETLVSYSTTAASNTPAGSSAVGPDLDDHLRDMKKNTRFSSNFPVQAAKTANYTTVAGDHHQVIQMDAALAARTVTLLAAATALDGHTLTIKKTDSSANLVTIDGNAAETIDGTATITLERQNEAVTIACDGTNWKKVSTSAKGTLLSITVFTVSGTWTKSDGGTQVFVECVGGGGGGGGSASASGSSGAAGGGGGGAYAARLVTSGLGATEAVTRGGGGAGGAAGANAGGGGGNTSFGAHVIALGGAGGQGSAAGTTVGRPADGGAGGSDSSSTGSIKMGGGEGGSGTRVTATTLVIVGSGGDAPRGGGMQGSFPLGNGEAIVGIPGRNPGGGGSGAGTVDIAASSRAGGSGADGLCVVWEFT